MLHPCDCHQLHFQTDHQNGVLSIRSTPEWSSEHSGYCIPVTVINSKVEQLRFICRYTSTLTHCVCFFVFLSFFVGCAGPVTINSAAEIAQRTQQRTEWKIQPEMGAADTQKTTKNQAETKKPQKTRLKNPGGGLTRTPLSIHRCCYPPYGCRRPRSRMQAAMHNATVARAHSSAGTQFTEERHGHNCGEPPRHNWERCAPAAPVALR